MRVASGLLVAWAKQGEASRSDFRVANCCVPGYSTTYSMPDESTSPPLQPTPSSPIPPSGEQQVRMWNMWCHLSALAGLVVPFGNVLGPLIIWQVKKSEFPSVDVHGKAALNFQLTVLIATVVLFIAAFVLSFFCIGYLLFPLVFAVSIAGIVFGVIAGLKANEGKDYPYPYSLNLIS
jgi:hypothetical protein